MSAPAQTQCLLDICDELAFITGIDADIRDVATRIANRGRTRDEADDVKLLIECRGKLAQYKTFVASHHPDGRR